MENKGGDKGKFAVSNSFILQFNFSAKPLILPITHGAKSLKQPDHIISNTEFQQCNNI